MKEFQDEIAAFQSGKRRERLQAGQRAALLLAAGIDLDEALAATPPARGKLMARLERLIERERLRGLRLHWSYDLNRHISLKQALNHLRRKDG